eukprot:m.35550 g.35550  ORF g.35550 m.35550 type:complete len:68 (-) comp10033_c0_seq1:601-804(-)
MCVGTLWLISFFIYFLSTRMDHNDLRIAPVEEHDDNDVSNQPKTSSTKNRRHHQKKKPKSSTPQQQR